MKFWKSLVVALVALLILVSVVSAQSLWIRELPTTVEITKGSGHLGIYDSDNYTHDLASWSIYVGRGSWIYKTYR